MVSTETSTQNTSDLNDEMALEHLFQPPIEIVQNSEWTDRYHAVVRRLRRDASGLPLDMAQNMLIERIASTYIRTIWFQTNGGLTESQLENLNKLYLAYISQFQKVLQASDEVLRQDIIKKFTGLVLELVKRIKNEEDRKNARSYLHAQFTALGF